MTKILLVGDIHARDKAPSGATEPYLDDLLDLLWQTVELASDCSAVVWAGDVFHEKEPRKTSHATVMRVMEVARAYTVPLYIVAGNHDISNDRLESIYDKQPLGVLFQSGSAEDLDGWAENLPLYGIPWQTSWDTPEVEAYLDEWTRVMHESPGPYLLVTHASIYPPGEEPPFDVLNVQQLADAVGPASVYYGHIHEDHGVYTVGSTTFANMGALSRGSRHEYNVQRDIKVCTWEDGTFEETVLDYKPAEEVLLMESHIASKEAKMDLDSFLSSIGTSSLEISSTSAVVEHIRSRKDVEKPVKDRAITILESLS